MYLQYVRPNAARPIRVTRRYDFRDNTPDSQGPRGPSAANRRQTTDRDRPERVNTVLLTRRTREFRRSAGFLGTRQRHAQLLKGVQSCTCTISAACAMARPSACARRESTRHLARARRSGGRRRALSRDSAVHGRRRDRAFGAGHSRPTCRARIEADPTTTCPAFAARNGRSRASSKIKSPALIQNIPRTKTCPFRSLEAIMPSHVPEPPSDDRSV